MLHGTAKRDQGTETTPYAVTGQRRGPIDQSGRVVYLFIYLFKDTINPSWGHCRRENTKIHEKSNIRGSNTKQKESLAWLHMH